jgi:peptidoglycan/xylan/chitin deacetylase (PgdA/CDA1 family)
MTSPWPDGARCAVTLTFDLDAESGWISRDPTVRERPGILSQGTYGPKVAVPRILEVLRAEAVPATFFIPGWVAEQHPERCRMIRDAGCEIGHHGYLHERADPAKPDEERVAFEKGLEALDRVLGVKPVGYRSPGWDLTPITLDLCRKHGFVYSSNLMDDAFPYLHAGAPPIVELPVQWALDDAPFFMFNPRLVNRPMQSPEVVFGIWRDEFLGFHEWGGLFDLTCHPQLIGQPSRLRGLRELVRLMKRHEGVWFATCREVAEHWLGRARGQPA